MELSKNSLIRQLFVFSVLAYLLNFFWEAWHAFSLYVGHDANTLTMKEYVSIIGYVSLMDMLLILAVLAGGALIWMNVYWFTNMSPMKWIYFLGTLILIAVVIEVKAVFIFNEWAYSDLMPTLFGMGMSPLIQLGITGWLSLVMARWVT